jgi:hypothetical protein
VSTLPKPPSPNEIPPGGIEQQKENLAKWILDHAADIADWITGRNSVTINFSEDFADPQTPHDAGQAVL